MYNVSVEWLNIIWMSTDASESRDAPGGSRESETHAFKRFLDLKYTKICNKNRYNIKTITPYISFLLLRQRYS